MRNTWNDIYTNDEGEIDEVYVDQDIEEHGDRQRHEEYWNLSSKHPLYSCEAIKRSITVHPTYQRACLSLKISNMKLYRLHRASESG